LGVAGAETIIGTGVTVTGDLSSNGDVTIDGALTGDLRSTGNVFVGVNAHIKASIHGYSITVAGEVVGNLVCENEASLLSTANVTGDITAGGLSISSGAIFTGQSARPKSKPPAPSK
jgi:cytoskeletal protein CcmA (bactofilin family)